MNNKSYQMESISSIDFFFKKREKEKENKTRGFTRKQRKKKNKSYWMEIISSFKIKEKGKK